MKEMRGEGSSWFLFLLFLFYFILLFSGASANDGKGLESPLHVAVQNASAELVHLLIDFGADTSALNAEGKKPTELVPPNSTLAQIFRQREGAH